jgi:hypothetical protein
MMRMRHDPQPKEETVAAKGKKGIQLRAAGYVTHAKRQFEMAMEIEFLNRLKGVKGLAQIVGVLAEGANTTRADAILHQCECEQENLLECVTLVLIVHCSKVSLSLVPHNPGSRVG